MSILNRHRCRSEFLLKWGRKKLGEHNMTATILRVLIIIVIFEFVIPLVGAQEDTFCALHVSILQADEVPVRAALVELINPSGKVVQSRNTENGSADFCDFGFGYHSIRVRSDLPLRNACETTVGNVKLIYGYSQNIKITLNRCLYGGSTIGNGCLVYLRVSSSNGEPIQKARIHQTNLPILLTDIYGRARIGMGLGSAEELIIEKQEFVTQKLSVECAYAPVEKEITIEMQQSK
jgi:hypothetical protein